MGRFEVPFCYLAVSLVLASALSTPVDASILKKYKLGSYEKVKGFGEPHGYRVVGKTVQGSQRFPVMSRYQQTASTAATTKDSLTSASVTSLLSRLIQRSSSRPSSGSEQSASTVEALSPLLNWLSGNGLVSLPANSAATSEDEGTEKVNTGSSTASLLSLIRNVLDAMRASESAPPPATEEADIQTSPAEATESRIGEIIMQLLGRQSSGVGVTPSTDLEHTQTNTTGSTASQLMTIIGQLLGHQQQPSETTDDDDEEEETSADTTTNRPAFDLMTFVRRLMGVEKPPSKLETKRTMVEIPPPMTSSAALSALARWLPRLDRSSPNSPERFASILMKLLSRMSSPRSSSSTTPSPSGILIKLLSSINKPGVSTRTSSTSTTMTESQPQKASSTFSRTSASLAKWLRKVESLRSSARSSSASSSLTKWLKALEKTGASQGSSSTVSSSPLIQWLRTVQGSRKVSSGRPAAASALRELLSAIQQPRASNVGWTVPATLK